MQIFAEYSIVTNIFHFLDHCNLLKFGTCSREFFHMAKFELNKNYPCPLWEVNDFLISLSSDAKFKKFHQGYYCNKNFFDINKGIHIYYTIKYFGAYLYVHSIYGNYIKILVGTCKDFSLIDDVDSQEIIHFNSFDRNVIILDSMLFNKVAIDITKANSPVICEITHDKTKTFDMNFASATNLLYEHQHIPLLDFLYQKIENPFLTHGPKFCSSIITSFSCKFDYFSSNFFLYQCDGHKVIKEFEVDHYIDHNNEYVVEDRFIVSIDVKWTQDVCYSYFKIFDMLIQTQSYIVMLGRYVYLGDHCFGCVSSEKKLTLIDLETQILYQSKNVFSGTPIGCVDGTHALFINSNNDVFRIKNIKDALIYK